MSITNAWCWPDRAIIAVDSSVEFKGAVLDVSKATHLTYPNAVVASRGQLRVHYMLIAEVATWGILSFDELAERFGEVLSSVISKVKRLDDKLGCEVPFPGCHEATVVGYSEKAKGFRLCFGRWADGETSVRNNHSLIAPNPGAEHEPKTLDTDSLRLLMRSQVEMFDASKRTRLGVGGNMWVFEMTRTAVTATDFGTILE